MVTQSQMPLRTRVRYQLGFIAFTRLSNIVRLWPLLLKVHPRFAPRAALIGMASLASVPLRVLESLLYGKKIDAVELSGPPVFIIGHWRSGTTHLHNLMCQDHRFGYLSTFQAILPDCSLIGGSWLKNIMQHIVPLRRPMDNMTWPMQAPQEEEIPLAKVMPHSFYTQFLFPRETRELFDRHVLWHGVSERTKREFAKKYHRLLQVATLHSGNRQLALKNPVNTARIPQLLALYPNAKFIHIHRCPYDVFASTCSLHRKLHVLTGLQPLAEQGADETVLYLYEKLMGRFFDDRQRIPSENLVEIRFDDLERDPLAELERVYTHLRLPDFETARPAVETYLAAQRDYKKNQFAVTKQQRDTVKERWNFAFSELGYPTYQ